MADHRFACRFNSRHCNLLKQASIIKNKVPSDAFRTGPFFTHLRVGYEKNDRRSMKNRRPKSGGGNKEGFSLRYESTVGRPRLGQNALRLFNLQPETLWKQKEKI